MSLANKTASSPIRKLTCMILPGSAAGTLTLSIGMSRNRTSALNSPPKTER